MNAGEDLDLLAVKLNAHATTLKYSGHKHCDATNIQINVQSKVFGSTPPSVSPQSIVQSFSIVKLPSRSPSWQMMKRYLLLRANARRNKSTARIRRCVSFPAKQHIDVGIIGLASLVLDVRSM
jgi:hypothetical protein